MNISVKETIDATTQLSRQENAALRSILFRHLDGFPIGPTISALNRNGVLTLFHQSPTVSLGEITRHTRGNEGYLQVAMRLLASQGWLVQAVNSRNDTIKYTTTNQTHQAFAMADAYTEITRFLPVAASMDAYLYEDKMVQPERELLHQIGRRRKRWGLDITGDPEIDVVQKQMLLHFDGILAGSVLVALGMRGCLDDLGQQGAVFDVESFGGNQNRMRAVAELFTDLGWLEIAGANWEVSRKGQFFFKRAPAYGVTVSYLPMFQRVEDLLVGDPAVLWASDSEGHETHVQRAMNVWGSGGAHSNYFSKIDEIIIEIFNRPIQEQPLGIADMGCGDGTFLAHIFDVIWEKTERAKMLETHPLFVIGGDYNRAALDVAKDTLKKADVWANVIFGDIGDPDEFAASLKKDYSVDLQDLLNVRSFLDHNRAYEPPEHIDDGRESRSTGAFSHRGTRITNNAIEQNLVDHLKKWAPHVNRFGLLVLELHTIPPKMAALNVGNTNVTAYDGTHGYSDQYILEAEVFLNAAREAGLEPDPRFQSRFPNSDLATISVNLLKGK